MGIFFRTIFDRLKYIMVAVVCVVHSPTHYELFLFCCNMNNSYGRQTLAQFIERKTHCIHICGDMIVQVNKIHLKISKSDYSNHLSNCEK